MRQTHSGLAAASGGGGGFRAALCCRVARAAAAERWRWRPPQVLLLLALIAAPAIGDATRANAGRPLQPTLVLYHFEAEPLLQQQAAAAAQGSSSNTATGAASEAAGPPRASNLASAEAQQLGTAAAVSLENLRHFVMAATLLGPAASSSSSSSVSTPPAGPIDFVFLIPPGWLKQLPPLSHLGGTSQHQQQQGAARSKPSSSSGGSKLGDSTGPTVTAQYVELPPEVAAACTHGWGAHGWWLRAARDSGALGRYRGGAVVLASSAVAGPFLPKYAQAHTHWLAPFLRKLSGPVKLVAPTISCAQTRQQPPNAAASSPNAGPNRPRRVPHPELGFVVLAADAVDLLLAVDDDEEQQKVGDMDAQQLQPQTRRRRVLLQAPLAGDAEWAVDGAKEDAGPGEEDNGKVADTASTAQVVSDDYPHQQQQQQQQQHQQQVQEQEWQEQQSPLQASAEQQLPLQFRQQQQDVQQPSVGGIFGCHVHAAAAEHNAAAGAAETLLARGWSLDTLLMRYQGVDWRDTRHWRCNAGLSPQGRGLYDGISIDPLETIFVRRNAHLLARGDEAAVRAEQLQRWAEAALGPADAALSAASTNTHAAASAARLARRRLEASAMGGAACFDAPFYAAAHPDLAAAIGRGPPDAFFEHYERYGMSEGRRHRWRCPATSDALVAAPLRAVVAAMAEANPDLPICDGELGTLWAVAGTLPAVCRVGARPPLAASPDPPAVPGKRRRGPSSS